MNQTEALSSFHRGSEASLLQARTILQRIASAFNHKRSLSGHLDQTSRLTQATPGELYSLGSPGDTG